MSIPDNIKENVRAVLLSKTDGSGILVSTFLRDYKSIIHKPLMYKEYGYQTLEKFIKDIPDVCRLEYSDQHMAFKLFGIAKPNTFVSSFVKRAEGNEDLDSKKKSSNKGEKITPTNDLNEKWEPSTRGLFSLCFPNKKGNGLETKEAVAMKFAQLGEVVEINIIPRLTFIRYRDEKAAKMAIELYSESLRLKRAEERLPKTGGGNTDRQSNRDREDKHNDFNGAGSKIGKTETNSRMSSRNKWGRKEPDLMEDENWDEDPGIQKSSPGGYKGSSSPRGYKGSSSPGGYMGSSSGGCVPNSNTRTGNSVKPNSHKVEYSDDDDSKRFSDSRERCDRGGGDSYRGKDKHPRGTRGERKGEGDGRSQRKDGGSSRSDELTSAVQVYVGNWPNEATENDLKTLISAYRYLGCRVLHSKDRQNKKFAFVDVPDEREANRMIADLDNKLYKGRDLLCRLGKKSKGDHPPTQDDSQKGGIEREFEKLAVHKDSARHVDRKPLLESPNSRSPNYQHKHQHKHSPRLNNSMPLLETPSSPYSQMPPLENVPDEMPPLENVVSPSIPELEHYPGGDNMPNLEDISPIKQVNGVTDSEEYNPVQLNVGNFPYGTSEHELMMILGLYGAQRITIMNKDMKSRSTYAFADFEHVSHAINAMDNLDQRTFKGRNLVVTLSNPGAVFQQQNAGQLPNMTCTITEPTTNADRTVAIQDIGQISPSPMALNYEKPYERTHKSNKSRFNFERLTTTLQDYTKIATRLRADEQFRCMVGMKMSVMITHVENEKFFWAQVLEDSVNGVNQGLDRLVTLAGQLQPEAKVQTLTGLGRCVAKFDNEWFRGWCTYETQKHGEEIGEIIFIDYGNRIFAKKSDMFKCKPLFWTLPPMAKPFKLVDFKNDLKSYVNRVAELEVVETCSIRTNSVITVQVTRI